MTKAPLGGFVVGVTADRKAAEQISMLERCGAQCVRGPVMRRKSGRDDEELLRVTQELVNNPPDYVLLTTGSGVTDWFDLADSGELLPELHDAISEAKVLVRGRKVHGAATTLGLDVAWKAPQGQLGELIRYLTKKRIQGKKIAVQFDGNPSPESLIKLRSLGADIVQVHPYEWSEPENRSASERLVRLVSESSIDAVTFTSRAAVHNFMAVAESVDLTDQVVEAFNSTVLAACIGPTCADATHLYGIERSIMPDHARLGSLVRMLANHFAGRSTPLTLNGIPVEMRGHQLTVAGTEPMLATSRERQVLTVLAERPGVVYSKKKLLKLVWGGTTSDEHVVEVTIGRLRRRLGEAGAGVETVRRRGYRLRSEPV